MLKHATICRTSKAQQALAQGQLSQKQQVQQAAQDTDNIDTVDGPSPTLFAACQLDWLSSSRLVSSSCSASPTPSPNIITSTLSSAPSSVLSSPSKHHNNNNNRLNGSNQTSAATLITATTTTTTASSKTVNSTIKVFAQTLSQDVEYVTFQVNAQTKSKQIIRSLLRKFRLKHRDPNLFFLTLERWIRKDGLRIKSVMLLSDDACPLQLQQCCSNPPHNDIKFTLQVRTGALMKIHCSDVCSNTRYKCLSLSTQTTVDETIDLMLHCLNLHTSSSSNSSGTQTTSKNQSDSNNNSNNRPSQIDQRQANSPSGHSSDSSTSSQSTSSSSSGVESDPTNQILGISSPRHLNLNSRASSVTSISSSSNISNNSSFLASDTSGVDTYCLVIECKDTNYRRVLESDEHLVDVYQGLLEEARNGSLEWSQNNKDSASFSRSLSGLSAATSSSQNDSATLNNSNEFMRQQSDQWFVIKLKKRDTISPYQLDLIRTTNPHKQLMPLPPIPQSLSLQLNNANELKHIVSTTQIEINTRPNSSLASATAAAATTTTPAAANSGSQYGSLLRAKHNSDFTSDVESNSSGQQKSHSFTTLEPTVRTSTVATPIVRATTINGGLAERTKNPFVCDDLQLHYGNVQQIHQHHRQLSAMCSSDSQQMPPPPARLIWLPPIKPRRRNLSNASSTFQRPPTRSPPSGGLKVANSFTCNRRRYDPIQLAKDLNELDLGGVSTRTDNDRLNSVT